MNLIINDAGSTSKVTPQIDVPCHNKKEIQKKTDTVFNTVLLIGCGVSCTTVGVLGIVLSLPVTTSLAIIGSIGTASLGLFGIKFITSTKETEKEVEANNEKTIITNQLLTDLNDLIDLSKAEINQIRITSLFLLTKPKISENCSFDEFIEKFNNETTKRITNLQFAPIKNEVLKNLAKTILSYNNLKLDSYTFEHTLLKQRFILKLHEMNKEAIGFYQEVLEYLKGTFEISLDSLQPNKLNLNAFLPLDRYNYDTDHFFKMHKKSLERIFKTIPENFPKEVLSVSRKDRTSVYNKKEFMTLRNEYLTASQQHEKIMKCLPKYYPIMMPNFLFPKEHPLLTIATADQFKQLISAYVNYLNKLEQLQDSLKEFIHSKGMLKSYLNAIK